MKAIEIIRSICEEVNSTYLFEYDDSRMMNVKVDGYQRGDSFVFVETVREGAYLRKRGQRHQKRVAIDVYFGKFTFLGNDQSTGESPQSMASSHIVKKAQILNEIEGEIIHPFITKLSDPQIVKQIGVVEELRYIHPPARFDANEVSILLKFYMTIADC